MNRYNILRVRQLLAQWYYEGKPLGEVELAIKPAKPFLTNLFFENGVIDHSERPTTGVDFEACIFVLTFYTALRNDFNVKAALGKVRRGK